jgi:hypothetical protein
MKLVFELEVFRLLNIERANYGVPPLVWNDERARNSRQHAINMAASRELTHDHHRLARELGVSHLWVGDPTGGNGHMNSSSPEGAVRAWMNSPGHRGNALSDGIRSIGVGVAYVPNPPHPVTGLPTEGYRMYWYTMFVWHGVVDGITEADLFASLGVPIPAPPTTPQTPNQTPTTPTTPQTPNQTPAPQPPAANVNAGTTTITHIGHRVVNNGRNENVQFSYTRTGNLRDFATWTRNNGQIQDPRNRGTYVNFTSHNEGNVLVITNRATGETFRLNYGEQVTLRTTQPLPIQINFGQIAGRVSVGEFGQIAIPVIASNIPDGVYQAAFWFNSGTPGVGFVDGLSIQGFSPSAINIGNGVFTYAVGEIHIHDGRGTLILINDGSASWTRRYWDMTLYIYLNGTWIHAAGRIDVA